MLMTARASLAVMRQGLATGAVSMHEALTPGAHSITVDGIEQRYHVHGAGPVCVVHPGGPGLSWDHMRLPGLESSNTMVYVEPIGTGESGRLPETDLYTLSRYASHLRGIVEAVGGRGTALLGHSHGGGGGEEKITPHPQPRCAPRRGGSAPPRDEGAMPHRRS